MTLTDIYIVQTDNKPPSNDTKPKYLPISDSVDLADIYFAAPSGKWEAFILNPDQKSMRPLTVRDRSKQLVASSTFQLGREAPRYPVEGPFYFGSVVELKIDGDAFENYDTYRGAKCNNGHMLLKSAAGRHDSAYGTCILEKWDTLPEKHGFFSVADAVELILLRFQTKHSEPNKPWYGSTDRIAVFEEEPSTCFSIIPWMYGYLTFGRDLLPIETENAQ
jgi:hypothetical protein